MHISTTLSSTCCLALFAAAGIAHAASLSPADKQFMTTAAEANMTEAHEGQMAENQASRSDVKDFGKTLAQDHTEAYQHLTELAVKTGFSIPKGINVARNHNIMQLVALKGERFDRTFIRDEIAAHQHALAVFKHEAAHGQDADIKAYASKMIPILEKHLHLAEEYAKPARKS